jgi:effector-binding domain-containing protein
LFFTDPASRNRDQVRFKVAVPVPSETKVVEEGKAAVEEISGCQVAFLTVLGPYTNLEEAYTQLHSWVFQHGYQPADAPREVYVKWGKNMPPQEWVTEIHAPVKR